MFPTRRLFQAVKQTTSIYGVAVHPSPRPHLISVYQQTLEALKPIPATAVYRQATEALTKQRLGVVEGTENVEEIERTLDVGQIEEVIMQAEDELKLISKMIQWKAWEPLEEPAPKGQWDFFSQPSVNKV
ncbi:ETC complex I subunit conserved region-domain-containing protein [Thamnocephalis sphaerospora]|uniref:ETC complex I subunit conserved region-domain-containing protein n=1 Tax=Thamnocephalis sphaerospora TaxID=78915 RepID=A0A4P9XNK1_9FUNG|nr:ETC complex I subunit conserved region-domain-containing protein [Thamnocephalis sphaerospora]|eukprot:RKP07553.1 ETC complex I subunit conserved region-domain-containing protein [Thamnocephalis sphaerospora]